MQITETCSCGCEFHYDDSNPANTVMPLQLQAVLNDFRTHHKCKTPPSAPSPF